jgi:Kelch motif
VARGGRDPGNLAAPCGVESGVKALLALGLLAPAVTAGGGVTTTGSLAVPRASHTATLLGDGRVLVAGGCARDSCETDERSASTELYEPQARRFVSGPGLVVGRVGHAAVRLRDGRVLVVGGWDGSAPTAAAELYHPRRGTFAQTARMRVERGGATATLLRDGRVLVVGGTAGGGRFLSSAELFDPRRGRFVAVGSMGRARAAHAATLLGDGRVLVSGGSAGGRALASTELFDPRTGRWTAGPTLLVRRHKHEAVRLRDGSVLVVGGSDERDFAGRHRSAELLAPQARRFVRVGPMAYARFKLQGAVVALAGGGALVAGGGPRVELYDPRSRSFHAEPGDLAGSLAFATATALADGTTLIAGGYDDRIVVSRRAWTASPR